MRVLNLPAVNPELENALDFISNSLGEFGISDKLVVQSSMLATEESLVSMIEHAMPDSEMEISVKKNLVGNVVIRLAVPGSEFEFFKKMAWCKPIEIEDLEHDNVEDRIRGAVMTGINGDVSYEYKKGINTVQLILKK